MNIEKQIFLLNDDQKLVLRKMLRLHDSGKTMFRNKDFERSEEEREKKGKPYKRILSRGDVSKVMNVLEVALIIERDESNIYMFSCDVDEIKRVFKIKKK